MSGAPLAGRRIVVTRPRGRAEGLAGLIRGAGGEPLLAPAIEIRELDSREAFFAIADRLESFDLAIFVSPTAVERSLALLEARRGAKPWPERLRVAAIGSGSARALAQHGFREVLAPAERADSEALLALPALAEVSGKRIVIFRGEGGRELLAETLARRGAKLQQADCYRRAAPAGAPRALLDAWARGEVDAVTVSSAEGLDNLRRMLGDGLLECLRGTPLFVPHRRVAEHAVQLGARAVTMTGPADEEVLAALVAYFRAAR